MNNVTPFPVAAPAPPVRALNPFEASGALEIALKQSLLALEIAKLLHQASVLQAHVPGPARAFETLPLRTQQDFRYQAEQAVRRLDPVAHRIALADARDLQQKGVCSFEEAVSVYFARLTTAGR